jgi:hypothetical protein
MTDPAYVKGRVFFNANLPEPIPANHVDILITTGPYGTSDGRIHYYSDKSDENGEFQVIGIDFGGQYIISADFSTATNIPEGFSPVMAEVNGQPAEGYQPGGYMIELKPVDIHVGSNQPTDKEEPTHMENLVFTLMSF